MPSKSIKISEETQELLNKVRIKVLEQNLKLSKASDNFVINKALKNFMGEKNGTIKRKGFKWLTKTRTEKSSNKERGKTKRRNKNRN